MPIRSKSPALFSPPPRSLPEHPLRRCLHDEIHARPPIPIRGEEWISHLAVLHKTGNNGASSTAAQEEAHIRVLCAYMNIPFVPGRHVLEMGEGRRLKWERHCEFSSYTFFRTRRPDDTPETTALAAFPSNWIAQIPGQLMVAAHVEFRRADQQSPQAVLDSLAGESVTWAAARIADGAAWVFSDFCLHDGFSRFLVIDEHLRHWQAGRTVQRLLEIETYRIMALLAFPRARKANIQLGLAEAALRRLIHDMDDARDMKDERRLLGALTRLASEVENAISHCAFRFGAAAAYYRLVEQRIAELREQRIDGYPPIREYMGRRLAPAMDTCASVARRQNELSERIARRSALLRTRVDLELERQNQQLLTQMNHRAKLQLHLQQTVEGLSVVAITYYASQLVNYLAKGISQAWWPELSPEIAAALSIPVIAGTVLLGLSRMRRALHRVRP